MNWANRITVVRILLVPVFVLLLLKYKQESAAPVAFTDYYRFFALIVFIVCVATDALDGFVARMTKSQTKLGTVLDPVADKLLLVSAMIILSTQLNGLPTVPIWVPVVIIGRDIILSLGILIIHFLAPQALVIRPSILGKVATSLQMVTVIGILVPFSCVRVLWCTAGILTFVTAIEYIYRGSGILNAGNGSYAKKN